MVQGKKGERFIVAVTLVCFAFFTFVVDARAGNTRDTVTTTTTGPNYTPAIIGGVVVIIAVALIVALRPSDSTGSKKAESSPTKEDRDKVENPRFADAGSDGMVTVLKW